MKKRYFKASAPERLEPFELNIGRIFCVIVAFFLVFNILYPSHKFSDKENRSLKQRPELSFESVVSGEFFKDFNQYYSDQFAGRNLFMSISSSVNIIEGKPEVAGVYFGKKGSMIGQPEKPNEKAVKETAKAINKFDKAMPEIRKYLLLVPNAAGVQQDRLPADAPVRNQVADIKNLEKAVKGNTVILDGVTPLKEKNKEYIYYKTDHHWTSYGAYQVFRKNMKKMEPDTKIYDYRNFLVSDDFRGTLASKTGRWDKKDDINVYEPVGCDVRYLVQYPETGHKSTSLFVKKKLDQKDQYQVFLGGNHGIVDIKTTAKNDRVLMILRDSYASSYVQFLYPYYSRIVLVDPRYYYDNLGTAIKTYGVTDMLYLYSGDTIVTDSNLKDALESAC